MFGYTYKPECHWCRTPAPNHTPTCRFKPTAPVRIILTCEDCGTKVDEHPTWCKHWVDYSKRPLKETK